MPCTPIKLPGGISAIVCGSRQRVRRCKWCSAPGGYQCDWKIGGGKTCDKHICAEHAQEVAPDKHLCPEHQAAWALWKARRSARAISA